LSTPRPIGLGLKCRRERIIARLAKRRRVVADLPENLTVHARFACHRWHAVCGAVHVNNYSARLPAVYAAAQEAFARLAGEGIPLRSIRLSATADADTFEARYAPEVAA
jgi:hypothetical protein